MNYYFHGIQTSHERRIGANRKNIINLESVEALLGQSAVGEEIELSADDGYKSVDRLIPIIEQYNTRLTLFITTGFIEGSIFPYEVEVCTALEQGLIDPQADSREPFKSPNAETYFLEVHKFCKGLNVRKREAFLIETAQEFGYKRSKVRPAAFLEWESIGRLSEHPLVEIGSHTVSHLCLSKQSIISVFRELSKSRRLLESKLNRPIKRLSYPYGACDLRVKIIACLCGYRFAYSTDRGEREARMNLPRIHVPRIENN